MTSKIGLRVWMFIKIAPFAVLAFAYWVNAGPGHPMHRLIAHPVHIVIALIVFGFYGMFVYYEKRTDLFDESAKKSLLLTDSMCMKVSFALSIFIIFITIVFDIPNRMDDLSWAIVGYSIVFLLLFFGILRAIIFSVLDRRGDING